MEMVMLGNTGLSVSKLCFGVLPMGPLQAEIPLHTGQKFLVQAFQKGINFLDTAESYGTYPYIRGALQEYSGEIVVATKSHAVTYEGMEESIKKALEEMGLESIDIFHLHGAQVQDPLVERHEALQCLVDYKRKGVIKAIGLASHSCLGIGAAVENEAIDVIFPLINYQGMGILDGSLDDMLQAIQRASQKGMGVYAMKALGGGNFLDNVTEAFRFILENRSIHSVAVGMVDPGELEVNYRLFSGEEVDEKEIQALKRKKLLRIQLFCIRCGACVETCPNGALSLGEERAQVDTEKCILCGYCSPGCPKMAIRLA